MHVMPHSPLSAMDVQTAGDAADASSVQQAASASQPSQRISDAKLTHAATLYRGMQALNCDAQDALSILFDYLNTGNEEGYMAVLRAAAKTNNIPGGATASRAGPSGTAPASTSASTLHGLARRPQLWEQRSWPEKVLQLKDGGAHASLRIGMRPEFFDNERSVNSRGHAKLPEGCLDFYPTPSGDPARFKENFYAQHVEPILRSLGPNQAAVFAIPEGGTLLQGRDEHGKMFGFATGFGSQAPRNVEVLRDRVLTNTSDMFRLIRSGPKPWAILLPRGLEVDKR